MDFILLKDFLAYYSLPTLIVAVIVSTLTIIAYMIFGKKMPNLVRSFLPFVLSVILYFFYDMLVINNAFVFKTDALYAGILSGSLSVIIFKAVKKIANGKPLTLSATALLIEGLIEGYVSKNALVDTVNAIETLCKDESKKDTIINDVKEILSASIDGDASEEELLKISALLVKAVKSVN